MSPQTCEKGTWLMHGRCRAMAKGKFQVQVLTVTGELTGWTLDSSTRISLTCGRAAGQEGCTWGSEAAEDAARVWGHT